MQLNNVKTTVGMILFTLECKYHITCNIYHTSGCGIDSDSVIITWGCKNYIKNRWKINKLCPDQTCLVRPSFPEHFLLSEHFYQDIWLSRIAR